MNSISDLTTFVEIVRAGSFVAAAKKLGVTPSGVSKKISRFEQRLGRLFMLIFYGIQSGVIL